MIAARTQRPDESDAHAVRQRWLDQALRNAEIDGTRWRPGAGVAANHDTIDRVYTYYGNLYLRHNFLEWAGMAALVGPALVAGFRDLGAFPDFLRRTVGYLFGRLWPGVARFATADLGFYEVTFLDMQKKVFEDQAVMHEAYLSGGIGAVEELHDVSIIDDATLEAWRRIDAAGRDGDARALHDGNRELLFREQHDILDRFYVRMFERVPLGRAFTYLLTLVAKPSLPHAKSFAEAFPLALCSPRVSEATLTLETPLADGNLALFSDRWRLIEANTLPIYLQLLQEDRRRVDALIDTPIAKRLAKFRLLARVGTLARNALTHWKLLLRRGDESRPRPRTAAGVVARSPVEINLRSLIRANARVPPNGDSRVWEAASGQLFDVLVLLPEGRMYRASAVRATLRASRRGEDPDRLVVTLPALNLEEARTILQRFAAEWDIPAYAIESWRERADLRAQGKGDYAHRAYSTQVFTAAAAGAVRFQMQVAQHLRDEAFVITALFLWNA
jgi:hypothetical protein